MVFDRFARLLIFRITWLTATLIGLSVSLTTPGYYSITLLLGIMVIALLLELYRYVSKTNAELTRFLEAARYGDFGQRFRSSNTGANFEPLSDVFSDIMQRFKTSRQQQEEKLRHLISLTEHIPVPLLSLYPDGHIQLRNNAARRLFGRVNVNKIEDLRVFSEDFCNAIKKLEPGSRRLVNFSDDGMDRQMTVVATTILTQGVSGTINENLISLQDIQSELDSAQLQAWQDLVRVLTHEMMNSITPIASLAKTATDLVDDVQIKLNVNTSTSIDVALKDLEDVRRAVDIVARRSDGLMQFVQGYRSLTQLPTPQKQTLLLTKLFQQVQALLEGHWTTIGIGLTVKVEPESLQLLVDPDLLEQILINLLKNSEQALCHCDNPHVTLVGRLNQRGYVLIEVADNGPGIPTDIANKVFVPFFTTKPHGSGVGLALTRQIMIAHGGSVTVNESDTGGAKFTLVF